MTERSLRPRVRPWVVAAALFAAGVIGRVVLEATAGDPVARFMYAVTIQGLAYGTGLLMLAGWWLRAADVGPRGGLGCAGWLALAAVALVAIVSSGYK
ncbi:MAG: hypothetical protein LC104_10095 [Bacteroidales bacterium]|nr:hypothetical protein [Bacteroidales bacterium]